MKSWTSPRPRIDVDHQLGPALAVDVDVVCLTLLPKGLPGGTRDGHLDVAGIEIQRRQVDDVLAVAQEAEAESAMTSYSGLPLPAMSR